MNKADLLPRLRILRCLINHLLWVRIWILLMIFLKINIFYSNTIILVFLYGFYCFRGWSNFLFIIIFSSMTAYTTRSTSSTYWSWKFSNTEVLLCFWIRMNDITLVKSVNIFLAKWQSLKLWLLLYCLLRTAIVWYLLR
jgi:hypothetical protein